MSNNGARDGTAGQIGPEPDDLAPPVVAAVIALRAPVEASPSFDARVMASVRAVAQQEKRPVWWRRRSISLSPVAAAALAAGIAVAAFLGARAVPDSVPQQAVAARPAQATETVRFVYVDHSAQHVAVVGSFNLWQKDATPLKETGVPGVWAVSVELPVGTHEYAFLVDGERWAADPHAPGMTDEFGTQSSIVRIQGPTSS